MSDITITETAVLGVSLPPTQDELPCDDGIPMETSRHRLQMEFLINQLFPWLAQRQDGYAGGNMFVYFSLAQLRNQDFRGPDFFVVLGVPQVERKSWVVWEEGKGPDVVIELLSDSTREVDKTEKKEIYQNQLRVPEYFWFDPFNPEDWAGFALRDGIYEPLELDAQNRFVSQQLDLTLVQWQGIYKQVEAIWLRWATLDGVLLPTSEELAQQRAIEAERHAQETEQRAIEAERHAQETEQRAIEAERHAQETEQRAIEAEKRAEQLAAQLRAMGIDPGDRRL